MNVLIRVAWALVAELVVPARALTVRNYDTELADAGLRLPRWLLDAGVLP